MCETCKEHKPAVDKEMAEAIKSFKKPIWPLFVGLGGIFTIMYLWYYMFFYLAV